MARNKAIKQLGIASILLLVMLLFFAAGATLGQAADPPPEPEASEAVKQNTSWHNRRTR